MKRTLGGKRQDVRLRSMLLHDIDAHQRQAGLLRFDTGGGTQEVDVTTLLSAAATLGLRRLHIPGGSGGADAWEIATGPNGIKPRDPSRAILEPHLDTSGKPHDGNDLERVLQQHRWSVHEQYLVYDAHFLHAPATAPVIAAYVSLLLAALGSAESQILQFRLAMYEMVANIVEHGILRSTPSSARADTTQPGIGIHLALMPGEVSGWIQDACECFDLSVQPAGSLRQHAESRASRGYGIHMMHQLLQSIEHEFNETGNRIHFRKRISP